MSGVTSAREVAIDHAYIELFPDGPRYRRGTTPDYRPWDWYSYTQRMNAERKKRLLERIATAVLAHLRLAKESAVA